MEEKKNYKVMIYQASRLFWGDLELNANLNPIHYLYNPQKLEFFSLKNAKTLSMSGTSPIKPVFYNELHISFKDVLASHFLPPNIEKYETGSTVEHSNELEVDITVGEFIFRGNLIFSNQLSLIQYIKRQSSQYITLSDVKVIHQSRKDFNKISTPYCFIKISEAIFGVR